MTPIKNRYCSQCFLFQACVLYSVFTESSFFIRFLYRLLTPACNNWCVKDISFCRCFLCPSNKFLILTSLKIFSDQDIAKDTLLGILIGSAHCKDQIIYIFERFTHWFWPQLLLTLEMEPYYPCIVIIFMQLNTVKNNTKSYASFFLFFYFLSSEVS